MVVHWSVIVMMMLSLIFSSFLTIHFLSHKVNPIPADFQPSILGEDCDTTSVGELAFNLSYNDYIRNTIELEDPW